MHEKLVPEHAARIDWRLKSGMAAGDALAEIYMDVVDQDSGSNDDDGDMDDKMKPSGNGEDDPDKSKPKGNKGDVVMGDAKSGVATTTNAESEEWMMKEMKKLVNKYTGQFDGRKSSTKFAFMVLDESKKEVTVLPIGGTSIFGFRWEQLSTAKTVEEVDRIHKIL